MTEKLINCNANQISRVTGWGYNGVFSLISNNHKTALFFARNHVNDRDDQWRIHDLFSVGAKI